MDGAKRSQRARSTRSVAKALRKGFMFVFSFMDEDYKKKSKISVQQSLRVFRALRGSSELKYVGL